MRARQGRAALFDVLWVTLAAERARPLSEMQEGVIEPAVLECLVAVSRTDVGIGRLVDDAIAVELGEDAVQVPADFPPQ